MIDFLFFALALLYQMCGILLSNGAGLRLEHHTYPKSHHIAFALGRPVISGLVVMGEISIAGTMMKVDELANSLQVCLDSGAKKILLPITSAADLATVPAELIGCFNLIFYQSAEDAVFKALGVE